jgi:hypothetical protein
MSIVLIFLRFNLHIDKTDKTRCKIGYKKQKKQRVASHIYKYRRRALHNAGFFIALRPRMLCCVAMARNSRSVGSQCARLFGRFVFVNVRFRGADGRLGNRQMPPTQIERTFTFTQRYTLFLFGLDSYINPSFPKRRSPRQLGLFAGYGGPFRAVYFLVV